MRLMRHCSVAAAACLLLASPALALPDFTTFESGQVRPLALSPDGSRLFAVNTPDNQLEIFSVQPGGLTPVASVPVGLEPVAVAARSGSEVWVVNHLSDSVSIVDVASDPPKVIRTLLVGDEPRDIVFAGSGGDRAFVTTAHRGQHRTHASISGVPGAGDPQLTTAGIGRADVWVFDSASLGATLGGTPIGIVTLFGDTPRSLAASPDGSTVYAAVFNSGNQTTAISEGLVCDGGAAAGACNVFGSVMPGGLPLPNVNVEGTPAPEVGLVLKFNPTLSRWEDELGRNWNTAVRFSLPDLDVFAINADANPPAQTASYPSVGTTLFDLAVNPQSGDLYVTNTEAINEVRFEGPGVFSPTTVQGHLAEARVTFIDVSAGTVHPRHLNKHIDYNTVPSPPGVKDVSLATPVGAAVSSDGSKLYVAAFGSGKLGVYDTATLENDSFVPAAVTHVSLTGGGPTGVVLDEDNEQLFVLTRFDNSIAIVDISGPPVQVGGIELHNPESPSVVNGRPFLYDAHFTSSNGEASCSSCHIFGDMDQLAWDLGNPDDFVADIPNPFRVNQLPSPPAVLAFDGFHPMKGPMTTQSLRGMADHGPMHWRGDRTGGSTGGDPLDEDLAFKAFNVAFEGLVGRDAALTDAEMQAYTDFILQVVYPPNPVRALDNSLTPDQAVGRDFYFSPDPSDILLNCNGCHVLNPDNGHFGSDGRMSFENEPQFMKIPHLRNAYQKIGMFGMPQVPFFNGGDNAHKGQQVRGFGFLHDGSTDTVFRFVNAIVFNRDQFGFPNINPGGFPPGPAGNTLRRQVEAFILAFDSNLAPIVGQQITLDDANAATVDPRIDVLIARDDAEECDVVVKGTVAGEARGWYRLDDGTFQSDRAGAAPISDATLRALASVAGQELTYTCAPFGSGRRIGVDRDGDLLFDGDERDGGSDPGDATSLPPNVVACDSNAVVDRAALSVKGLLTPGGDDRLTLRGEVVVDVSELGGIDPATYGFGLRVADSAGNTLFARTVPGGDSWRGNRSGTRWTFRDRDGLIAGGIISVTVADRTRRTPGLYRFAVRGRKGDFPVAIDDVPLEVSVVLGGGLQTAFDQCGRQLLAEDGQPRPSCRTNPRGDQLRCR